MQGDADVIELLNDVLTAELTAINQYFADAKMCENWGYERLAKRFRDDSIDEMKDAEQLMDRILYLEGIPNLQRLGSVRVGMPDVETFVRIAAGWVGACTCWTPRQHLPGSRQASAHPPGAYREHSHIAPPPLRFSA